MPTTFRLRQILEARGMTQAEIAELAGVGLQTIGRLCRNDTGQVSLSTLDKIAAALNIAPGDLIERKRGR